MVVVGGLCADLCAIVLVRDRDPISGQLTCYLRNTAKVLMCMLPHTNACVSVTETLCAYVCVFGWNLGRRYIESVFALIRNL